jgi:hypothetical protein
MWQRITATGSGGAKYAGHAAIWLQFFCQAATVGVSIGGPS